MSDSQIVIYICFYNMIAIIDNQSVIYINIYNMFKSGDDIITFYNMFADAL